MQHRTTPGVFTAWSLEDFATLAFYGEIFFPEDRAARVSVRALNEVDDDAFTINLIAFSERSASYWRTAIDTEIL